MANSDKSSLLARRKLELDHAIKHGFDQVKIARRADRVRAAVIAVLKKDRSRYLIDPSGPRARDWKAIEDKWRNMSTDEVIEMSRHWTTRPSSRDLGAPPY
jgi:hypothetical protein